MTVGQKSSEIMVEIPNSTKQIDTSASVLFLPVRIDTAIRMFLLGEIPTLGEQVEDGNFAPLGDDRLNRLRAARTLPKPWSVRLGDFVPLDLTPCTRGGFASVTGQQGATKATRAEIAVLCISHRKLLLTDQALVYADRLCIRYDVRFSGDPGRLCNAPWQRIRERNFRPDPRNTGEVYHYDACALAWGSISISAVEAIVFKDDGALQRFFTGCPDIEVSALIRPNLLW